MEEDIRYYLQLGFALLLGVIALYRRTSNAAKRRRQKSADAPSVDANDAPRRVESSIGRKANTGSRTASTSTQDYAPKYFTYDNLSEQEAAEAFRRNDNGDESAQNTEDGECADCSDFDLRKAVIYSEILKPKFDEE